MVKVKIIEESNRFGLTNKQIYKQQQNRRNRYKV